VQNAGRAALFQSDSWTSNQGAISGTVGCK
jgi:hypothetical protein